MEQKWTAVIKPKKKAFDLNLKETFKYRDLIWLFVTRDFKTRYKQTVLGHYAPRRSRGHARQPERQHCRRHSPHRTAGIQRAVPP